MASQDNGEAFPALEPTQTDIREDAARRSIENKTLQRAATNASSRTGSTRRTTRGSSVLSSFATSNPPLGMWQATGEVSAKIPTLPEIKNGAFSNEGWSHEGQLEHRGVNPHDIHKRRQNKSVMRKDHEFFPGRGPTIREEGEKAPVSGKSGQRHTTGGVSPVQDATQESVEKSPIAVTESMTRDASPMPTFTSVRSQSEKPALDQTASGQSLGHASTGPDETGLYPNGYRFPKKHTWTQTMAISSRAFGKFACTPFGFLVTVYAVNIVAWGAMLFFLALKAAPAMCHVKENGVWVHDCDSNRSPRKIWIEVDSQILNALFIVTGFGLAPWRFRDLFYLWKFRIFRDQKALRRLAGINRSWFRLQGSQELEEHLGPPPAKSKHHSHKDIPQSEQHHIYTDKEIFMLERNPAVPLPASSMPEPPLTGLRAPPTPIWTLDWLIYMYVINTFFQVGLCIGMYNWNRIDRPGWITGTFIALGCCSGIAAGGVVFWQGGKVKKIEGIPVQEYDHLESAEDYQLRIRKSTEKVKGHHWFTRH